MSIAYIPDGLPRIFNDFGAYPNGTFASEFKTMIESAGWSLLTETISRARIRLTGGANAANGNQITLLGISYTFRTTITNTTSREVLIGATPLDTMTNLYNCIMDNGIGKGTLYTNATPGPHGTYVATAPYMNNTVPMMDLRREVAGFFPHDFFGGELVSSSSGVIAFEENFWGGGYIMKSQVTPDGLGCSLWLYGKTSDKNKVFVRFLPRDGSFDIMNPKGIELSLDTSVVGRRLQIVGNPYQIFVYLLNASTFYFCGGVPYLPDQVKPLRIVEATNTIPIKIRTDYPHGWPSGTQVFVDNVKGNTAANGQYVITYVNEMEFTLNGTSGNGEYDTSEYLGAVAIESRTISRCIWYSDTAFIRNTLRANNNHGIYVNNMAWGSSGQPTGALILESFDTSYNQHLAAGMKGIIYEPTFAAGVSASTVTPDNLGILWDAVMINRPYTLELVTRFDGNNWRNLMQETNTSLWHVVPL